MAHETADQRFHRIMAENNIRATLVQRPTLEVSFIDPVKEADEPAREETPTESAS